MITLKPLQRHMERFTRKQHLENRMMKRFGSDSSAFKKIMHATDAIADTHRGKPKRRNEDSRLVHEREMLGIADFLDINSWVIYVDIMTHDGPEDYRAEGWSYSRIKRDYGAKPYNDVRALTNPVQGNLSDHDYNLLLADRWRQGGRRVVLVKSIDRTHGLLHPWPGGEKKMITKMLETERYLIPLMVELDIPPYKLITAIGMLQRRYGLDTQRM